MRCILYVCVFTALALACEKPPSEAPIQLVGVWATDAPTHADRFLEFSPRTITFGTGDHGSVTHYVHRVESTPGEPEGAIHYTFDYDDASGERYQLGLVYRPTKPVPTLLLDHRDEIWRPRLSKPGEGRERERER
jgi:hypothetical protein